MTEKEIFEGVENHLYDLKELYIDIIDIYSFKKNKQDIKSNCEAILKLLSVPNGEASRVSENEASEEVCETCRNGFWLKPNTKCLDCGRVNLS